MFVLRCPILIFITLASTTLHALDNVYQRTLASLTKIPPCQFACSTISANRGPLCPQESWQIVSHLQNTTISDQGDPATSFEMRDNRCSSWTYTATFKDNNSNMKLQLSTHYRDTSIYAFEFKDEIGIKTWYTVPSGHRRCALQGRQMSGLRYSNVNYARVVLKPRK